MKNLNLAKGERNPLERVRVHKASDDLGDIWVIDNFNHRLLTFDSIYEQSRMDKDLPFAPVHDYTKAMLLGLLYMQPQAVLLLGLGAGGLLRAIHKLDPQVQIEAVEIRAEVVKVAEEYFGLPKSDKVHITIADGEAYLEAQAYNTTDMIFADMYQAYDMDPLQKQVHFLQQCHRVLTDNGWLVMNFHEMPGSNSRFMLRLVELFPEVLVCMVPKGNFIIYAGKQRCEKLLGDYYDNLPPMEAALHTPLDTVHRRLSRLQDAAWMKRKNASEGDEDKMHFSDEDYPPVD